MSKLEDLTPLEVTVLKALFASSNGNGNGHDFGFTDDDGVRASCKPSQLGAIIASLSTKNILTVYPPEKINGEHWVTQFSFNDSSEIERMLSGSVANVLDGLTPDIQAAQCFRRKRHCFDCGEVLDTWDKGPVCITCVDVWHSENEDESE